MPSSKTGGRLALMLFAVAVTLMRGILASRVELAPDEAYYWKWSTALSFSYPDHPPLIAWLIRFGTAVAGENSVGVRLFGLLGSLFAMGITYGIARELDLDERHSAAGTLLSALFIAPAAAAFITTPDTPLGLAWLSAQFCLIRIVKNPTTKSWYLLGASVGTAILSKYSGLLLLPVIGFSLWGRVRFRQCAFHLIGGAVVAATMVLPHLISEWHLGFSTGRFQGAHLTGMLPGAGSWTDVPSRFLEIIAGQFGLLTPLAAFWVFRGLWVVKGGAAQILKLGLFIPICATFVAALFTHPEQNWAALGHPSGALLAMAALVQKRAKTPWRQAVVGSAALCFLLVHLHLAVPFLPLHGAQDPTARLHGWARLDAISSELDAVDAVVCDNYGLAAEVAWHFRDRDRTPPVFGADREVFPVNGRLLLLNQTNDFGSSKIPIMCGEQVTLSDIELETRQGETWDRVTVSKGARCRLSRPPPSEAN